MSAYTVAQRGRQRAQQDMRDACVIKRRTGETTDGETGVVTPTFTTIYDGAVPGEGGPCKVQRQAAAAAPTDVGQASLLVGQLEVHVPMSVTGAAADDLVTITASVLDPALAGRTFRVRGVPEKTYLTARRLACIEVTD